MRPQPNPKNCNSLIDWCVRLCAILILGIAASTARADSGAGNTVATSQSAARLVSAVAGVGTLDRIPAGLDITLKPGWKTYWRSPGDAGFPPMLSFDGSENVAKAEMAYPTPHRFSLFGLETFGYKDEVVYPIAVTPANPGAPVKLRAHLRYLVCADVCIPYEADLALDIAAGGAAPSDTAPLLNRFQAMVPGDGRAAGLTLDSVAMGAGQKLVVKATSAAESFAEPDVIVEGPASLVFDKPSVALADNGHIATITVPVSQSKDSTLPPKGDITLTFTDGERGLEQHLTIADLSPGPLLTAQASPAPADAPSSAPVSLAVMLGIAVLGGLILNVMPCVLPVLVLKLTSVLGHGGGEARHVRLSFLATAAGIAAAFLVLAASLSGLKLAGHAIGWGIQFQQPVFLAVLAALCLVFAANLWGWFEVPLPALAGDLALAADRRAARHKMLGAFLTGIFATILATPCSAPFVGTAIGFALSRGAGQIFAIFLAMALGLALPYLAVAAVPGLATRLPRPGRWMLWLKKLLGISMAATAVWLVWILAGQTGLLSRPSTGQETVAWQSFNEASIPGLVASGKTVFVDVTADWCLTCKANKTLVIDRPPVSTALDGPGTIPMVADWTRPDPAITAYLTKFDRYGIPLNVVYGPKAPNGIALPELLTGDAVLAALKQASGS
ncbi:MAG TPA: protein-disulfide reductase DsbD domain-containing protein [Dongiaceae bacterium]|nr:protein-disulfide reductase DsbD domain-containing protein [Dongiaceae bacterium]